jgi:hypothetical protein
MLLRVTPLIAAVLAAGPAFADPAGDAFCRILRNQVVDPNPGAIYFLRAGKIEELPRRGANLKGWGSLELYYFRKRMDAPLNAAGAVTLKIKYALSTYRDEQDKVKLRNNRKALPNACERVAVNKYERFHGAIEEPNYCLRSKFHQRAAEGFETMAPPSRRRSFQLDVPDVDTRGLSQLISSFIPQFFKGDYKVASLEPPSGPAKPVGVAYRSWITNYQGQNEEGSCIRFAPEIAPEYVSATLDVVDLLETENGDYPRGQWVVSFDRRN